MHAKTDSEDDGYVRICGKLIAGQAEGINSKMVYGFRNRGNLKTSIYF